jgi:serine/threonine-protein kinase TTK/MPS1
MDFCFALCGIKSKRVKLNAAADPVATAGYIEEAKLLHRLNAEGCAQVVKLHTYEINHSDRRLYLVMEMGEMDMARMLAMRASEPVDVNFVRYYWSQMLECVRAVHLRKVIHADLKPANFLMVRSKIKLIDFGTWRAWV